MTKAAFRIIVENKISKYNKETQSSILKDVERICDISDQDVLSVEMVAFIINNHTKGELNEK
jgi:hypothetical protein